MTDRRTVIGALAGALLIAPLSAEVQHAGRVPRIGLLATGSLESHEVRTVIDAFRQGLRERGYVDGQNIVIEYRGADDKFERLLPLMTELARMNVDVIVTATTAAARAAQQGQQPSLLWLR